MSLFDEIRSATARVTERARFVEIDRDALSAILDDERSIRSLPPMTWDEETHYRGDPEDTLAYVITLGALNFGSGWFPFLEKREGRSGYFVQAMGLRDRFREHGAYGASELEAMGAEDIAQLLQQRADDPALVDFFELQARSLRDLGLMLRGSFDGRFEALIAEAGQSAERLIRLLSRMPLFRDVATDVGGLEVPFYKRAQITASDLVLAFGGEGFGSFGDADHLTAFADNTLPHVLRCHGALRYEVSLAAAIDGGAPIAAGSPQEVAIRAGTVQAVDLLAAEWSKKSGCRVTPRELDGALWSLGRRPEFKAKARHRTQTPYY